MIEQLTIENLEKYDFSKEHIEEIMRKDNYESDCTTHKGQFFVSQIEQKIYSDKEYFVKRPDVQMHFPHHNNDLFEKYYDIKLGLYLKKKRSNPGKNFNEQKNKERFKEEEIKLIESIIEEYKKQKPLVALRISEKIDSYQNYLDWLNDHDPIQVPTEKTLQTNYTSEQIKKLLELLIGGNYIKQINENNFIYFFSGKPLNGIPKIYWNKSKRLAVNLLDKICMNPSFTTVNNCIQTKYKKFDSNDRPKRDFNEIEGIIKLCDPLTRPL
jgi:hypothetical protein